MLRPFSDIYKTEIQLKLLQQQVLLNRSEMVGWHHRLNGHEFEQALGDDEGQGGLVCWSPWGHEESDTTE